VLAVHDLGAGCVDVAVLQRTADGFLVRGVARGSTAASGHAMDAALAARVSQRGGVLDHGAGEVTGPNARSELERACTRAREALDGQTRVFVPGHDVELTRADVDAVVTPVIEASAGALLRVLSAAGVARDTVALVSVGGCAAMPAVSRVLRSRTGLVALPNLHATLTMAMGAARLADSASRGSTASGSTSGSALTAAVPSSPTAVPAPRAGVGTGRRPNRAVAFASAVAVVGLAVAIAVTLRGRPAAADPVGAPETAVGGRSAPGLIVPSSVAEASSPAPTAAATSSSAAVIGRCPTRQDAVRWVCLERAQAGGRTLSIKYTLNFSPVDRDEAGYYHVHFYTADPDVAQGAFVTSPRDATMQQIAAPHWGTWYNVYATGLTVLDASAEPGGLKEPLDPSGFSLLCVRVAEGGHILAKDLHGGLFTGNCVAITH
jgi:Hsp70 protein